MRQHSAGDMINFIMSDSAILEKSNNGDQSAFVDENNESTFTVR